MEIHHATIYDGHKSVLEDVEVEFYEDRGMGVDDPDRFGRCKFKGIDQLKAAFDCFVKNKQLTMSLDDGRACAILLTIAPAIDTRRGSGFASAAFQVSGDWR
jgi:hypothetical protein